jgi:hypothetical protein
MAYKLLFIVLTEDVMTTENIKSYSKASHLGCKETYRLAPVKSCMTFLYKLSVRCQTKDNAPLYGLQDEVVVGYESSWAGISKDANLR